MKRIIGATIAAVFTVGLIAAPPAHAGPKDDRMFYTIVTSNEPAFKAITRKKLVSVAKQSCKTMRSGFTPLEVHDMMTDSGFTDNQATAFVAGAILFYCPEQEKNI